MLRPNPLDLTSLLVDDLSELTEVVTLSPLASAAEAATFGATQKTALYLIEAGDTSAVSMNDIHQGQIGDCYLLSPIGELAATHPAVIQNMIHANADGSETVTLYLGRNGAIAYPGTTALKTVTTTVTNVFPTYGVNNGATQDVVGSTKEIWAQVLEKAVAQLGGGYSSIANGGNPAMAMQELTGQAASFYSPGSLSAAMLQSFAGAGDLITFDTKSSGLGYNLVGNHAYMFKGIVNTASGAAVSLGNPWGVNQPGLIPVSQFAKQFVEIDVGRVS